MKQFARKEFVPEEFVQKERSTLSLVGASPKRATTSDSFDVSEYMIKTSFHGWLCSIAPDSQWRHLQPLTTEEFLQVSLSTVREGSSHCRWPRDVFEKFLAAEVIPRSSGS
jgi:hypothetical protein